MTAHIVIISTLRTEIQKNMQALFSIVLQAAMSLFKEEKYSGTYPNVAWIDVSTTPLETFTK